MKKEIVIRKSIYTGKEHKLIWSGTGKLYYFKPAEDWMPVYLNFWNDEEHGTRTIQSLDSDGFGYPLEVGEVIDNLKVEAILEVDEKICVMISEKD